MTVAQQRTHVSKMNSDWVAGIGGVEGDWC